jgi:transposase-like protein
MLFTEELLKEFNEELQKAKSYEDLMGKGGAIKKLIGKSIEQLMEVEMDEHLGYSKHSSEGNNSGNSRNGYKEKNIVTSEGEINIEVPQDRNSSFTPLVVKKHQKRLGNLEDAIISLYSKGLSVSDIRRHIEEIYGANLSESSISVITGKVNEMVIQWQSRELKVVYPVIFLDAIHYKVKQDGKVITKAAYTALGIDLSGHKDILGIWIAEEEGANYWRNILAELSNRGVKDILIACVDGLKGFPDAIKNIFPQTVVQQCIIHQIRNAFKYVAYKDREAFMNDLKPVYKAPSEEIALENLELFKQKWEKKYRVVVNSWVNKWEFISPYLSYTENIRKLIYTTNAVENLHRQFRKVTNNKTVFTNDKSLIKMLFLAQKDLSDKWTRPVPGWSAILSELLLVFEDRLKLYF